MLENYGRSIAGHVEDGNRVKGLFLEPLVNCPPNYGATVAHNLRAAGAFLVRLLRRSWCLNAQLVP